jgi:integrase
VHELINRHPELLARSVDEHQNATWRAYRADLDDFGSWVRAGDGEWSDPSTVADYLRALENAGAKYSTIERRITSIAKLVEVLVAIGQRIDTTTRAGRRDVALLLVGWYGAMRRSEIASIRREHVEIDSHAAQRSDWPERRPRRITPWSCGSEWLWDGDEPPVSLKDRETGAIIKPLVVDQATGQPLELATLRMGPNPHHRAGGRVAQR